MMADLRARFLPRFVETARTRLRVGIERAGDQTPEGASVVASELHTMAGEAAMLGFTDVADLARAGESAARSWRDGNDATAAVSCARSLHMLSRAIDRLATEATKPAGGAAPVASAEAGPRRVLIVDDSAMSASLISDAFEGRGWTCKTADSLAAVAESLTSFRPGVVLMDVQIPGFDTAEIMALVRRETRAPAIRVLLVSGLSEGELRSRCQAVGADGFACKREGTDNIVARVESLPQRSPT